MELAAVRAIAELAQAEQSDIVAMAYGEQNLSFGPDYLIPRPFDPRLIAKIAPAVAQAAMESGVATRPIPDLEVYREQLNQFVYQSGFVMKPVFAAAKEAPRRIAYAEGEEERVLRAAQVLVDEGIARPDPDRPPGRHQRCAPSGWACDSSPSRISTSSTRTTIRAIASTGRNITGWRRAAGSRLRSPSSTCGACRR